MVKIVSDLYSDTRGEDQEAKSEHEEDGQPVSGGPVVPGLGVHPHLTHGHFMLVRTGHSCVDQHILVLIPADLDTLGISDVGILLLNCYVVGVHLLPSSKPNPISCLETNSRCDNSILRPYIIKPFSCLVCGQNIFFKGIIDTY